MLELYEDVCYWLLLLRLFFLERKTINCEEIDLDYIVIFVLFLDEGIFCLQSLLVNKLQYVRTLNVTVVQESMKMTKLFFRLKKFK